MRTSDDSALGYDVRYDVIDNSRETLNGADQMLSELCHDVRQPLTTIRMNLQAIVRLLGQPTPRVDAALDAIADCLDAGQEVDALFAGLIHRVRPALASTCRIALNNVALDVRATLLHAKPDLDAQVELCLAEHSPIVKGDAAQLRFALLSLVRQGLAYDRHDVAPEHVVVATRQAASYAELSVSGLPQPLVFGRQRNRTLAVTHSVVRAHGGIARIESRHSSAIVRIVLPGSVAG